MRQIVAEMLGKANGATQGKGGSMHYYKKDTNFYGGNGIVGAQIPVGVGLAFALKYRNQKNVASIMFGDGAANQGQLFESANMAKLMNLPALFICENNIYGMGTSVERASMNPFFYTRGDRIPGIRADGNNIFQVREVIKFAKKWSIENGPLFLEFMTYRYHGHSMSDPGTTYRSRDEVQSHRKTTDPIVKLGLIMIENKLATPEELEKIDEVADDFVVTQVEQARGDPDVSMSELTTHIYVDNENHYVRGKLYEESYIPKNQQY